MYVSHGQFYVFTSCIAFGSVLSLLLVISFPLVRVIKSKLLKTFIEFLIFVIITALFNYYSYVMQMGNFRFFMPFGVFLGVFLGYKTFGFALAKASVIVYNIYKQKKRKKGHGVNRSKRI